MIIFVAVMLAASTAYFIVQPLLRTDGQDQARPARRKVWADLASQRDAINSSIEDLEFEFKSGSLSEQDYADLKADCERRAASIAGEISKLGKGTRVDDEMIEKQVQELRRVKDLFCSQCGARSKEGDKFCSACGSRLSSGRQE